jgi:hypothetical protein
MFETRWPLARSKIQMLPSESFVVHTQSRRRAASTCMPSVKRAFSPVPANSVDSVPPASIRMIVPCSRLPV